MTARQCWLAGALVAAGVTAALHQGIHDKVFVAEWGLALILTLTQGAISLWINARALAPSHVEGLATDTNRFFVWAIGAQGLRVFLLVCVLGLAYRAGMANFAPFLEAALAGYVVMMAAEIWSLHSGSLRQVV